MSSNDNCLIPNKTVQIVQNCPTTDAQWMEAANRKNCSAFANLCNGTYKYHCLIDPNINELVEVCMKQKVIHLGCAEFSMSSLQIISNYMRNCSKFPDNPCPMSYSSTKAYKYPGCYELKKKSRNEEQTTQTNTSSKATTITKVTVLFATANAILFIFNY